MNPATARFVWQSRTSVLVATAFVNPVLSGAILFVSPPGRIAHWTNWTLLGLRKADNAVPLGCRDGILYALSMNIGSRLIGLGSGMLFLCTAQAQNNTPKEF